MVYYILSFYTVTIFTIQMTLQGALDNQQAVNSGLKTKLWYTNNTIRWQITLSYDAAV